jgi:hypothetical protein
MPLAPGFLGRQPFAGGPFNLSHQEGRDSNNDDDDDDQSPPLSERGGYDGEVYSQLIREYPPVKCHLLRAFLPGGPLPVVPLTCSTRNVINTLPVKEAVPMIRSVTVNHLGYGRWDIRRRETKRDEMISRMRRGGESEK